VFLSSPSDVDDERRAAVQVQNRINSEFGLPRRRLLHIVMWENFSPSFGRTQDWLNDLVDSCDLFVGVLHERWGTPTGGFTSGFEEEFTRATDRRRATGSPEIALFFKAPTQAKVDAPDADYAQLAAFKKKWSQTLTYKTFVDLKTWESEVALLLTKLVLGDFDSAAVLSAAESDVGVATKAGDDAAIREHLAAIMASLPEREQIVLALRYVEGLDDAEVAVVLGEPIEDVRDTVDGALRVLRDQVMGDDPEAVRRLWESMNDDGGLDRG
jgi:DNA-directed RNA polymerase specialized sigma24 family protein